MAELILALVLGVAAVVALAWAVGAREEVYKVSQPGANWFVALKRSRQDAPAFAPGLRVTWFSRADSAFVGPADPYWTEFYILNGEAAQPIQAYDAIEDAFAARIELFRPPPLILGMLRILIAIGALSKPRGPVLRDGQSIGHRPDVMPSAENIAALLAQPAAYAPAMVNFLAYYPSARYAQGGSGRAAYMRYGRVAMRTVYRTGGHLLFFGRVRDIVREADAGPCAGKWDDVAAMQYMRPDAILSMEHAPDYRASLVHRDAGTDRTIVIASTPGAVS